MAKQTKKQNANKKIQNKANKPKAVKVKNTNGVVNKKLIKKHRDYLRGIEKRREELVIANRATHNAHEKEIQSLDHQILEWKARIAAEVNGVEYVPSTSTNMTEE